MHMRMMGHCVAGYIPEPLFIYRSNRLQSSALSNQGLMYRKHLEIYSRYLPKMAETCGLDALLYEQRLRSRAAAGLIRLGLTSALANADTELLANFEKEALAIDPSPRTRAAFFAWRLLNNTPGRFFASLALTIYHAVRRRRLSAG